MVWRHKHPAEGHLPTLQELMALSNGGEHYKWMCLKLIPFVVGYKLWIKQCYKGTLSEFATCSDETFVLLTLENNYDRWKDEAEWIIANKEKEVKDQTKKAFASSKYTNSGTKANGKCRHFQGWSRVGYVRFNELYQLVLADRTTGRRDNFEKEMLATLRSKVTNAKEQDESEGEEVEIYPCNELTGVLVPLRSRVLGSALPESSDEDEDSEEEDPYNNEAPQA